MKQTFPTNPCLCSEYTERDTAGNIVEAKIDGIRCIVRASSSDAMAWTRNGMTIELPEIVRAEICSLASRRAGVTTFDCELADGRLWLFDLPDLQGSYRSRRRALESIYSQDVIGSMLGTMLVPILHDPDKDGGYPAVTSDILEKALNEGFEGIVLKDPDSEYQHGVRSWHKVKPVNTVDLVVVGVTEKGSLVVNHDGTNVIVGIGLDKDTRAKAASGSMLGKVIEITFQEETVNGSLRHPVFVREREDKTPLN